MQYPEKSIEKAILALKTESEVIAFLQALLSRAEVDSITNRWAAVCLLMGGQSQRSVAMALHTSTATVSRAAHVVRNYRYILEVLRFRLGGGASNEE